MAVVDKSAEQLRDMLRAAWGHDTTNDPDRWSPANPAWGQCAVTALAVQEVIGGDLLRSAAPGGSHYWNRLPDGTELDLTREQFRDGYVPHVIEQRDRAYVLSFEGTRGRYEALCARLRRSADQTA